MAKNKFFVGMSKVALAAMLTSVVAGPVAFAKEGDIWDKDNNNLGNGFDIFQKYGYQKLVEIVTQMGNYKYEVNEKIYNLSDVNDTFNANPNADRKEIFDKVSKDFVGSEKPVQVLKVESVSAINGTELVAGDDNQKLGFVVNGDKTITLKQLTDAGYTVKFLTTSATLDDGTGTGIGDGTAVSTNATGLLNTAALRDGVTFKYTVTISKEGQADITSGVPVTVKVKAVDKTKITNITEIGVFNTADGAISDADVAWDNNFITLDFNTGDNAVAVAPVKGTNILGTEIKPATGKTNLTGLLDANTVVTYESSNPTVALVNSSTGVINPLSAGKTVITVKVNGKTAGTVSVVVKDSQTPTALKEKTKSITAAGTVNLTVVDEDGKDLRVDAGTFTAEVVGANKADIIVTSAITDNVATLPVVVTKADKPGTYTVNIKLGDKIIDTLTLKVVAVPTEADKYEIIKDGDSSIITEPVKFDLKTGATQSLTVAYQGYDSASNLKVGSKKALSGGEFTLVSSNDKVVTIDSNNKLKAIGVGTAQVKLVQAGYVWDTIDVEVANTTPQITNVSIKNGKTAIEVTGDVTANKSVIADIFDDIDVTFSNSTDKLDVSGTDLTLAEVASIVDANGYIKSLTNAGSAAATAVVEEVKGDKDSTLVIKFKDTYGGKSFALPVVIKDKTAPTVTPLVGKTVVKATDEETPGTSTIVFSEKLNATSKTAVENAIKAEVKTTTADKLSFSWSTDGLTLTISNSDTTNAATFAAAVKVNITDISGNSTNDAVIVAAP